MDDKPKALRKISDMDYVTWYISDESFDWLLEQVENPPPPTQALIDLLQSKAVWESDEDHAARLARYRSLLDPDC